MQVFSLQLPPLSTYSQTTSCHIPFFDTFREHKNLAHKELQRDEIVQFRPNYEV